MNPDAIPVSPISAPISGYASPQKDASSSVNAEECFRDAFIQSFDTVRVRLHKSEELLKYFITLASVRIDQERGSIRTGSSIIDRPGLADMLLSNESCIAAGVESLRSNIIKRSQLSRQFVEDVKSEVIDSSDRIFTEQKKRLGALVTAGSSLSKQLQAEHKLHDESIMRFDTSLRQALIKVRQLQPLLSPSDHIETGRLCYRSARDEEVYHEAVFRVNKVRSAYVEDMEKILTQMEELERARLEAIKEGLDKLFVFEIALNRGVQYELESSFKEIQDFQNQITYELSRFISINKPKKPSSLRDGPVKIISPGNLNESEHPLAITPPEMQSIEHKILNRICEDGTDFTTDELEAIKEAFASQEVRLSFCRALASKNHELPHLTSLQELGKILNLALTSAESEMDSETGRRIASFALKFFITGEGRKKFIQSEIYHHSLWNRIQFWEEALAITVADSFVCDFMQRLDAHLSFLFVSGITVDRFGSYLMVFGLNVNSALEIVKRVMTREFSSLDSTTRSDFTERLIEGIKTAHEKQERNIASLSNVPSPQLSP